MLDILAMKALEARIVLVEYPSQAVKIVAGGANFVSRAIKTGRCRLAGALLHFHGNALFFLG